MERRLFPTSLGSTTAALALGASALIGGGDALANGNGNNGNPHGQGGNPNVEQPGPQPHDGWCHSGIGSNGNEVFISPAHPSYDAHRKHGDKPATSAADCKKPNTPEEEPDVDTPDVDTPDVDTPDVDTPDVDTPDVDTPDVDTPDVDTPDVDTPDTPLPTPDSPGTQETNETIINIAEVPAAS